MTKEHKKDLINKLNFEDVLLNSLPNPVYYKDTNGKFIQCNTSFSNLVKTKKENIIGKSAYDFFPQSAADRHRPIDKKILKTFKSHVDEIIFPMPNGNIGYFTLNKAVYLNSDGSVGGIVCVMNDITKRIKDKNFLIQKSKFVEMGEMIASIAHQWNEPLVELSAQIQKFELFYSMNKVNKKKMTEFVKDTMTQIQYMSTTLGDFRNFLKPSTTKHKFEAKQAIKEIFQIVGKQIFYLNIDVKYDYQYKNKNMYIYGFKNEFKQVILSMINNAKNKIVKLSETSSFKGIITIKLFEDDKFNYIEVIDNAGAINKEIMEQLFEPFFTTKADGTGFGLYMAKIIIEDKMNGLIEVSNDINNVTFRVQIPIINRSLL